MVRKVLVFFLSGMITYVEGSHAATSLYWVKKSLAESYIFCSVDFLHCLSTSCCNIGLSARKPVRSVNCYDRDQRTKMQKCPTKKPCKSEKL